MYNQERYFQELHMIENSQWCYHLYKKHSDMLRLMAEVKKIGKRKTYREFEEKMISKHYID